MTSLTITGTRKGCTPEQRASLIRFMASLDIPVLIHGACKGVDREAHEIARTLDLTIFMYPGNVPQREWALAHMDPARDFVHAVPVHPAPELQRNRNMVDAGSLIVGVPRRAKERRRSGTWMTIRYARHRYSSQKALYLILPDGTVMED